MRTDTVKTEYVYSIAKFSAIKSSQKIKQKPFTLFYTFKSGGDFVIEQLIVKDGRAQNRKGVVVLKVIGTGKWMSKHLGIDDFIELHFSASDIKELSEIKKIYEVNECAKNKLVLMDITGKGYMK